MVIISSLIIPVKSNNQYQYMFKRVSDPTYCVLCKLVQEINVHRRQDRTPNIALRWGWWEEEAFRPNDVAALYSILWDSYSAVNTLVWNLVVTFNPSYYIQTADGAVCLLYLTCHKSWLWCLFFPFDIILSLCLAPTSAHMSISSIPGQISYVIGKV